jgi:hypothetical protein
MEKITKDVLHHLIACRVFGNGHSLPRCSLTPVDLELTHLGKKISIDFFRSTFSLREIVNMNHGR